MDKLDFEDLELKKHMVFPRMICRAKVIDTVEEITDSGNKNLIIFWEILEEPFEGAIINSRIRFETDTDKLHFNYILERLELEPLQVKKSEELHGRECLIEIDQIQGTNENRIINYYHILQQNIKTKENT